MSFDKDRMHGEVFGVPGVKWEQAGRLYDVMLNQVEIKGDVGVPVAVQEPEPAESGDMSMTELREFAKLHGVPNVEKMSRAELRKAVGA